MPDEPLRGERSPLAMRIAALLLLAAGIAVWVTMGSGRVIGAARWGILAGCALLAGLPPVAGRVTRALDRIRHPSARQVRWATVLVAIAAAGYFILTAMLQDRDLFAKTHDDSSYLIQMQMLARGRLWMPAHPLADFFDSFYLIVSPVYASQYFPGTALMYVPTIWLNFPLWLMPVLAAGAVVGLSYRIFTELMDGAAGAVAALWVISLSWFRMLSILLMSQVPALLLGLVMLWAWLRWRRSRHARWLLLVGVAAGWAAITRPVDALCFAVPVGTAIAFDLVRAARGGGPMGWIRAACILVAGAAPFLCLQLIFDKGVTGHFLQTPFQYYLDRDVPGTQFGFPKPDPAARPVSVLKQKQDYYREWVAPYIERHQPRNLAAAWAGRWFPMIVDTTMPVRAMLPLGIVGLMGLALCRRAGPWVLWATLPLFVLLYLFYTIFLEHYAIAVIPAIVLTCLLGVRALSQAWPTYEREIISGATVLIVAACVTSLWEVNRSIAPAGMQVDDETFRSTTLRQINEDLPLASDLQQPAVILFRYHPGDRFVEEPVYNTDVSWPDDAPIIRAHDLGPKRDKEIVDYYAARKPARMFYLFDTKSRSVIEPLGTTDRPAAIMENLRRAETNP